MVGVRNKSWEPPRTAPVVSFVQTTVSVMTSASASEWVQLHVNGVSMLEDRFELGEILTFPNTGARFSMVTVWESVAISPWSSTTVTVQTKISFGMAKAGVKVNSGPDWYALAFRVHA